MQSTTAQFTTRARVVDLLGREQIADAPTAMGELFKNAIDALATNVRIDYWPEQRCLQIGDDGLGMRTNEELLAKWFVLATDSKHGTRRPDDSWFDHATDEQRSHIPDRPFGKKGIGRLAIALLGSGTLVWTRWGSGPQLQRTLLFVPWSIFRHPQLTLDQIEIPMMTLDRTATAEDAKELIKRVREWTKNSAAYRHALPAEVEASVREDLLIKFEASLAAPIQFAEGPGTQFVVLNTDEIVANHFARWLGKTSKFDDDEKDNYPDGPKAYLAFNNPFATPRLKLSLWHNGVHDRLERLDFWRREDFARAEHYVNVTIDETGFAKGTLRRGTEVIEYEANLGQLPNRAKPPGPLRIELGYVGGGTTCKLPPELLADFNRRLPPFGGFYVYLDDVRVQPYGRDDSDILGFEKRRSLQAGRYYFSHRRMFGGVFLSSATSGALQEKAGREGFVQNGAYHGLVHYLRALFLDLADSTFGSKAADRPDHDKRNRRYKEKEQRRIDREKHEAAAKEAYVDQLETSRKELTKRAAAFRLEAAKLNKSLTSASGDFFAADQCSSLLEQLRTRYDELWDGLVITSPSGLLLDDEDNEAAEAYLAERDAFDLEAKRALRDLANKVEKTTPTQPASSQSDDRQQQVNRDRERFTQDATTAADAAVEALQKLQTIISARPGADLQSVLSLVGSDELKSADLASFEEFRASQLRHLQEVRLPFYKQVVTECDALARGDSELIAADDLREDFRRLKEREQVLLELAQLGLVMESTDHDYNSMMGRASDALKRIEASGAALPKGELETLKDTLQHLDAQLQNWDPLVRRVRGQITQISGAEVWNFVLRTFDKQQREGVLFDRTAAFEQSLFVEVKRPVLLGAIHNIVMNGGYWALKAGKPATVKFSNAFGGFVISDSGHGVPERDRDRLFDPGFSRRPMGRGLGLYIARSCLRSFGYDLELLDSLALGALPGANFLIKKTTETL
jgi:signal transduction histidine kinase